MKFRGKYSQIAIQLAADVIAIILSYFVQFYVRFGSELMSSGAKPDFTLFMMSAIVVLLYWLILFFFSGLYKNWYERSPFDELFSAFRVILIGCMLIVFLVLFDSSQSPRMLFLIYFIVLFVFVAIGRTASRRIHRKLRRSGIISIPVIVIGTSTRANELFHKVQKSKAWGFRPLGIVLFEGKEKPVTKSLFDEIENETSYLGDIGNLDSILDKYKPLEVLITCESGNHNQLVDIVTRCAERNIRVKIEPDLYEIFTGQTRTHNIYGMPLIEITPQLLKPWEETIKRIFDIVFSSLVIILGMPVWILTALIIKLESKGPVFYKQPREGKDSKVFQIFKFRSMVTGADKDGPKWTSVGDPRVTRVGKFIRKTHLDEIPQFWNVLKGDMSIVGPRPEQPKFAAEFAAQIPHYRRRLKVRPGITGWWQVKYQAHELNKNEMENRLKDDFYYIENMSLRLDIEIVIRTVYCVLTGHGQT